MALRVNPDIDAQSHPHISTGLKANKFGVPIEAAPEIFRDIRRRPGLQAVGVHIHIGSQITTLDPLLRGRGGGGGSRAVAAWPKASPLRHLDFGGGLGISYDGAPAIDAGDYVRALVEIVAAERTHRAHRAGPRASSGPAGVLLTRVVDVKHFEHARRFVVLDAGMTELMRPALYGAFHRIEPVRRARGRADRRRHRRSDLREHRHVRARSGAAAGRSRRPDGRARRRRLRRGDGLVPTCGVRCRPKCWSTATSGA